jgi:AraC-like DNA-binding protein
MPAKKADIPTYSLDNFRPVHRQEQVSSSFGYNNLDKSKFIPDFELYSSVGLVGSVGPLRSEFYRMSITVSGSLDMQIGLEHFRHQPRTIGFTVPNQIFQKNNISKDAFGYYMLFKPAFLQDILPAVRLPEEFPFFGFSGTPLFRTSDDELTRIIDLVMKMDEEIRLARTGKIKAVQFYLYLLLLEAKRSYLRQQLHEPKPVSAGIQLVSRFQRLVANHFLSKRQVADYARLLSVSANHLNKTVKEITGRTASDNIREMLAQEAKSLLRYTDSSISEIAYQLDFSDPASFNRFFRAAENETPLNWRKKHN